MNDVGQDTGTARQRLETHYRRAAKQFLQTAIIVDDQAFLGPHMSFAPSDTVQAPTGSLLSESPMPAPPVLLVETAIASQTPAGLNAKVLSDAFLKENMICGLYKPSAGEDMAERTIGAARHADIVIVDWNLEPGSSRAAKDIILGLLKADHADRGRLRLIAVYTSQTGRAATAAELLREVEADTHLQGLLKLEGSILLGGATRIVFLNKRGASPDADADAITEEALPQRLVEEFAQLGQGLLASFALSSVTAVRRGAHHVLAQYGSDLDGAFAAHRCGIPHPDDSETFATDMMVSEFRNLMEINGVAPQSLGAAIVETWVEARIEDGHIFRSDESQIPNDQVKTFVRKGAAAVRSSKQHPPGKPQDSAGKKAMTPGRLARAFYKTAAAATTNVRCLSRLSTFQRETGRNHYPEKWLPILSLGSVLQGPLSAVGTHANLLVCVQPRCDSVRLTGVISFPFQTVAIGGDHFNLVLRDLTNTEHEAWVKLKPRDARMIDFEPNKENMIVQPVRSPSGGYVFKDTGNVEYTWLGDLKDMKAQRLASDLGSRVNSVGIEEFEWLRLAGEREFTRNWT